MTEMLSPFSPLWRAGRPCLGVALAVCVAAAAAQGDESDAALRRAAERDAQGIGWLLELTRQNGLGLLAELQPAGEQLEEQQQPERDKQIAQQAEQMQRFLQPVLASELEMIRQACGGLDSAARKRVLASGRTAVTKAARGIAERQLAGRLGRDEFDPRAAIRAGLVAELRTCAAPGELTAYERELGWRADRQARAARLRIVAKLDHQLDLSADQRQAIEADLARRWQPGWLAVLSESGVFVNNYPLAPAYATAAIESHLAAEQKTAWEAWCRAAGSRMTSSRINWNFDGQGLQNLDDWWTK